MAACVVAASYALFSVGVCLYAATAQTALRVWRSDEGPMVAIPGVPGGELVSPGSWLWWCILVSYSIVLLALSYSVVRRVRAKRHMPTATPDQRTPSGATPGSSVRPHR